jgi:hypothetical protein
MGKIALCTFLALALFWGIPHSAICGEILDESETSAASLAKRSQATCVSIGGTWDAANSRCVLVLKIEETCNLMGGQWMGTWCRFPIKPLNF